MLKLLIPIFILFSSLGYGQDLFELATIPSEKDDTRWEIKYKKNSTGYFLYSIGGTPKIYRVEEKSNAKAKKIWLIYYDAGMAGTNALSQLERVAIFTEISANNVTLNFDEPIRLVRWQGLNATVAQQRTIEWSKDNLEIKLGPFEDQKAKVYHWKK